MKNSTKKNKNRSTNNRIMSDDDARFLEKLAKFEEALTSSNYNLYNDEQQRELARQMREFISMNLLPKEYRNLMNSWSELNLTGDNEAVSEAIGQIFTRIQEQSNNW